MVILAIKSARIFFGAEDVLHIKGVYHGWLGWLVANPLSSRRDGYKLTLTMLQATLFGNNLKAGGFLQTDNILNSEQRQKLRGNLEYFSKPENAGKYGARSWYERVI